MEWRTVRWPLNGTRSVGPLCQALADPVLGPGLFASSSHMKSARQSILCSLLVGSCVDWRFQLARSAATITANDRHQAETRLFHWMKRRVPETPGVRVVGPKVDVVWR